MKVYCRNCKYSKVYIDVCEQPEPICFRKVLCCSRRKTPGGDYTRVMWAGSCKHYERKWWKFWANKEDPGA